jgi:hypothetical protein
MADRRPILVTGSHRSGSTWVGRTLALDSHVAYIHEPFNPIYDRSRMSPLPPVAFVYVHPGNADEYRAAVDRVVGFSLRTQPTSRAGVVRRPQRAVRVAGEVLIDRVLRRRPLVKDPLALFASPWLANEYGMDTVVLVRHPAGFVSSLLELGWRFGYRNLATQRELLAGPLAAEAETIERLAADRPEPLAEAAHLWRILHRFIAGVTPTDAWRVYRYEDIAAQPLAQFGALYERLVLPLSPAIERKLAGMNESADRAASWHDRLGAADVARIRELTDDVASRWYADDEWSA